MPFYQRPVYGVRGDARIRRPRNWRLIVKWLRVARVSIKDFGYNWRAAERYAAKVRNSYVYKKATERLDADAAAIIYGHLDPTEI